ncbi:hypothetical protein WJX81_006445 [Elliptochloris bilobata]|uniref:CKK domain-containing protein n=1 Tax=Elliptochloris bilobata TaxID=381761 RepID=A0AAW1SEA6_9CHLO
MLFTGQREEVLAALDAWPGGGDNFLVLFQAAGRPLCFRGLFALPVGSQNAVRVAGGGPERVDAGDTAAHFHFDSGSKTFLPMSTLIFSARTSGMALEGLS